MAEGITVGWKKIDATSSVPDLQFVRQLLVTLRQSKSEPHPLDVATEPVAYRVTCCRISEHSGSNVERGVVQRLHFCPRGREDLNWGARIGEHLGLMLLTWWTTKL